MLSIFKLVWLATGYGGFKTLSDLWFLRFRGRGEVAIGQPRGKGPGNEVGDWSLISHAWSQPLHKAKKEEFRYWTTILDRIKKKQNQPYPRINDELALQPKRAIFFIIEMAESGLNFPFILPKIVNLGQNKIRNKTISPFKSLTKSRYNQTRHFFHHWNWGRGGLSFSFILSKIVVANFLGRGRSSFPLRISPASGPDSLFHIVHIELNHHDPVTLLNMT